MFFRHWRAIPAQLAAILAHQIATRREIRAMRASTQHLIDAVTALTTSLAASNKQISDELTALLALKNVDDSDPEVEAQAQKIRDLVASNDKAVTDAQNALATVPTGPAGDAPAAQPQPEPTPTPPSDGSTQTA